MDDTVAAGLSRRDFAKSLGLMTLAGLVPGLRFPAGGVEGSRIKARPRKPNQRWAFGQTKLWDRSPFAYLHVPKSYDPTRPIALMIALHGAGSRANSPLRLWTQPAEDAGFALLVPESDAPTWDAIRGDYGPDVRSIDRALDVTFSRLNVDPQRITLGGFSDGASYTLGLGLENADLFPRLVACSPGFITRHDADARTPRPSIFVSHGDRDPILPFDNAVGRVIPRLRDEGCKVEFHEFQGGHMVPPEIARGAAKFVVG